MIRKLAPRLWQWQRWRLSPTKANPAKGFTLLELLVSLAIGSIIVYTMLILVVELLKTNQREAARSDTQREVQSALDYIARDLREAVYVYDGNCLQSTRAVGCPSDPAHRGLLSYLPTGLNASSGSSFNIPILAFWRVDPLPSRLVSTCATRAADFSPVPPATLAQELAGIPCVSRRMYTLVVYSLRSNPVNDPTWKGKSRITRYTLPQFSTDVAAGNAINTTTLGWFSPIDKNTTFPSWPLVANGAEPAGRGTPALSQDVLIDFVDDQVQANGDVKCPILPATVTNQAYVLTPTVAQRRGFYTCVNVSLGGTPLAPTVNQPNQEVVVYINGNAAGRGGIPRDTGNLVIPMETRVLTRGALNKSS
jgi:prepilin-type N-terminal cleavage/methylation domain-containing protein